MVTKSILLVDDDENDVFFFRRAVSKAGVLNPLQIVQDGQAAIDYLRGAGKFAHRADFPLPSLILLDLKLPFVMGLEVLSWIRQQSGLCPIVVILSSSREEADIEAAYRLGANAYLVKPADASKLGDLVRAICDFWLVQNTPPLNFQADRRLESIDNARARTRSLKQPSEHSKSDKPPVNQASNPLPP